MAGNPDLRTSCAAQKALIRRELQESLLWDETDDVLPPHINRVDGVSVIVFESSVFKVL